MCVSICVHVSTCILVCVLCVCPSVCVSVCIIHLFVWVDTCCVGMLVHSDARRGTLVHEAESLAEHRVHRLSCQAIKPQIHSYLCSLSCHSQFQAYASTPVLYTSTGDLNSGSHFLCYSLLSQDKVFHHVVYFLKTFFYYSL